MIASVNPLASAAGLRILRNGGNAVDAAITAGAVLTVVEPLSGQLGGDAFMLVALGNGRRLIAINGSGAAPLGATLERYQAAGSIPDSGWLAATVPGLVDAWRAGLELGGTMPLGDLLADAIGYADDGFPVTARLARGIGELAAVAASIPETRAVFFPDGRLPSAGFWLRQPDLARTLRTIQAEGAEAFYQGRIARSIVSAAERAGGLLSVPDFAHHRTVVLEPIHATYRGWTVLEQPPVSQGLIVLVALNILETMGQAADPAERIHLQVEAHKLALSERLRRLGDRGSIAAVVDELLSKEHARSLARRIEPGRAMALPAITSGPSDTSYLCVVDEARNIVSYIHSLYGSGGSGVVAGNTGVLLNNRMGGFSLEEPSPNQLAPGKRPMHTLNSWMLLRENAPTVVGGTPGFFWQVQTNLQLISYLVDQQLSPQAAVDAPRWAMGPPTSRFDPGLSLEGRFGEGTAARLRERGHEVRLIGDWDAGGAVQLIQVDGPELVGAGDPRPGTSSVIGY